MLLSRTKAVRSRKKCRFSSRRKITVSYLFLLSGAFNKMFLIGYIAVSYLYFLEVIFAFLHLDIFAN